MPDVISNSSPLQYLYQAGLLDLLPALFGQIGVPESVAEELKEGRRRKVPLPILEELPWVEVRSVRDRTLLPLVMHLGDGEKQVFALGLESSEVLLLLDDRAARQHARALHLQVLGTLGITLIAKERARVNPIRPIVDRLEGLGFRLDVRTGRIVLELAGENR